MRVILDKLAAQRCVALQDSKKRVSNGVIESYQYLSRQAGQANSGSAGPVPTALCMAIQGR